MISTPRGYIFLSAHVKSEIFPRLRYLDRKGCLPSCYIKIQVAFKSFELIGNIIKGLIVSNARSYILGAQRETIGNVESTP